MKLLHDSVISPKFGPDMSAEDIQKSLASRKRKVRSLWLAGQAALVVSYTLECFEQYYLRILKNGNPSRYLSLSNRIATLLTELPINLAQLYYMVGFLKLK
jgi:hypothetical protein